MYKYIYWSLRNRNNGLLKYPYLQSLNTTIFDKIAHLGIISGTLLFNSNVLCVHYINQAIRNRNI